MMKNAVRKNMTQMIAMFQNPAILSLRGEKPENLAGLQKEFGSYIHEVLRNRGRYRLYRVFRIQLSGVLRRTGYRGHAGGGYSAGAGLPNARHFRMAQNQQRPVQHAFRAGLAQRPTLQLLNGEA